MTAPDAASPEQRAKKTVVLASDFYEIATAHGAGHDELGAACVLCLARIIVDKSDAVGDRNEAIMSLMQSLQLAIHTVDRWKVNQK